MLSVLNQNLRRRITAWVKSPGFSTTAMLTLALGIGVASVTLSLLFATFGTIRYPKASMLASSAANDAAQVSRPSRPSSSLAPQKSTLSPERERPLDKHGSAHGSALRNSPQRSPNRRRVPGSVACSAARTIRSRMQRQQNRSARCIQTGVGDLEHSPNAQRTDTTIKTIYES